MPGKRSRNRSRNYISKRLSRKMSGGVIGDSIYDSIAENIMMLTDSYKFSHYAQYPVLYEAPDIVVKDGYNKDINEQEKNGAYNVSYFETRGSNMTFGKDETSGTWNETIFFGLQYFIKKYLLNPLIIDDIKLMNTFVDNHVEKNMFPLNDWNAILAGHSPEKQNYGPRYGGIAFEKLCDKDLSDEAREKLNDNYTVEAGRLPIRIDALTEGQRVPTSTPLFKITNTHPRFYWLPNYLETLFVQVWYPMTICTSSFLQRKILNNYTGNMDKAITTGPDGPALGKGIQEDLVDLLDFGFRGVSSLQTAQIGSMSYLAAGFIGSDTPVGVSTVMKYYKPKDRDVLGEGLIGSSIPASEHSTITSWCKYDDDNSDNFNKREREAWMNQLKQYGLGGITNFHSIAFVIDGYNTWNAILNQFLHPEFLDLLEDFFSRHHDSGMRLIILRPDSGDATIILPQIAYMLIEGLIKAELSSKPNLKAILDEMNKDGSKNLNVVHEGIKKGFVILQGDSVDPQRLPSYCASIDNAGLSVKSFRFGSGGGLLQKVNRDTFECAFKCCAMSYPKIKDKYSNLDDRNVIKNPITSLKSDDFTNPNTGLSDKPGGKKKSKAGWIEVDENFQAFSRYDDKKSKSIFKNVFLNGKIIEETNLSIGDIRGNVLIASTSDKINQNDLNLSGYLKMLRKPLVKTDLTIPNKLQTLGAKWFSDKNKNKTERESMFRSLYTQTKPSKLTITGPFKDYKSQLRPKEQKSGGSRKRYRRHRKRHSRKLKKRHTKKRYPKRRRQRRRSRKHRY